MLHLLNIFVTAVTIPLLVNDFTVLKYSKRILIIKKRKKYGDENINLLVPDPSLQRAQQEQVS